tara:strand:- start:462 stop:764 length:303 start_codon:yes stop_codon:yes gene_type:complete
MKFFKFTDGDDPTKDLVIPVNRIRGMFLSGTASTVYFDGIGAYDANTAALVVFKADSGRAIAKAYAEAAAAPKPQVQTFFNEVTGEKLSPDMVSYFGETL